MPQHSAPAGEAKFAAEARRFTQMDQADSKFVGYKVNFEAQPGNVQQQASAQPGRLQVVYALRSMRRVQSFARAQCNDNRSLNREISNVATDRNAAA